MPVDIYEPDHLKTLQTAFDRVWNSVGPTYGLSKEDVARLVIALAREDKIDIDQLVLRTMSTVMADVALVRHRFMWSTYTSTSPWLQADHIRPLLLH